MCHVTHIMFPILFSIGPVHIFSFSIFLVLSWVIFSFMFWKALRRVVEDEQQIFDLMFYSTLAAVLASRLTFVAFHWQLFADTPLKIFAFWVQPGLSLYGGLFGCIMTLLFKMRQYKLRLAFISDALAFSLPSAFLIGQVGSLLDGTVIGKETNLPFTVRYAGHIGARHPVQIYIMLTLILIIALLLLLQKKAVKDSWSFGIMGIWFFLLYSLSMFVLEFLQESSVYFSYLSANQWVLIAVFAQTLGAFYVRGGGREYFRPKFRKVQTSVLQKLKGIYAKFPIRRS